MCQTVLAAISFYSRVFAGYPYCQRLFEYERYEHLVTTNCSVISDANLVGTGLIITTKDKNSISFRYWRKASQFQLIKNRTVFTEQGSVITVNAKMGIEAARCHQQMCNN